MGCFGRRGVRAEGCHTLAEAGGCSSRDRLVLAERAREINADRSHAAGSEAQGNEASCGLGGPVQVRGVVFVRRVCLRAKLLKY